MGQRGRRFWIFDFGFWIDARVAVAICCAGVFVLLVGCERTSPTNPATNPTATRPATALTKITVASLSPAATDILIGLGDADRLVAISNFDPPREATRNLPRVGDYQTTDWERLATLYPDIMVTQFGPGRTPQGLQDKAASLHIRLVNVSITRLNDIYIAMQTLADAIGQTEQGRQNVLALRGRLDSVASKSAGRKVRALIVVDSRGRSVAGHDNYLDDILTLAGGHNVISPGASAYPQIDREMLLALDPEVIFQLLPDASPQVVQSARQMWQKLGALKAVRNKQVHIITKRWALSPSQHVADLAQIFVDAMGPLRK